MRIIDVITSFLAVLSSVLRLLCNPLLAILSWLHVYYVTSKGVRTMKLLRTNDSVRESYQLQTATGGTIRLLCTERVYEMDYTVWWAWKQIHTSYTVTGTCSTEVPAQLADLITRGFSVGPLLPAMASTTQQKKVAMYAFASLLLSEIAKEKTKQ